MSYNYELQKKELFTEDGIRILITMRDTAKRLLADAGAFRADKVMCTGDAWVMLAALDYMVEKKEIRRVSEATMGQYQVFVEA